jgi:glycosyltransferase involved in cell wall biosynthesis
MEDAGIAGEVVVADNNSDDGSPELAAAAGARVVHETRRGYGSAYLAGFAAARGEYIVMGDADLTYDFGEIPRFVALLDDGAQLVMGDRMDNIHPGAMPWLHRYVGNPILTGILNLFFRTGVSDAHCGMRGFRRDILPILDLRTTGMEFASEMVIRASKEKLDIREFPIEYHPRGGESKLSSFRDGWRHLRFLLVHSPTHLFVIPSATPGSTACARASDSSTASSWAAGCWPPGWPCASSSSSPGRTAASRTWAAAARRCWPPRS